MVTSRWKSGGYRHLELGRVGISAVLSLTVEPKLALDIRMLEEAVLPMHALWEVRTILFRMNVLASLVLAVRVVDTLFLL